MNHLRDELPGATVWDIYAGSGILGLEALSRGAAHVLAVEKDGRAVQQLRENAELLRLGAKVEVLRVDAHSLVERYRSQSRPLAQPDLIFFDPPYDDFRKGGQRRVRVWQLFCELARLLADDGAAIVHTPKGILTEEESAELSGIERRDYGSTSLYWWHRRESEER